MDLNVSLGHIIAEGEFIFRTSICASLKNTSANANVFFLAGDIGIEPTLRGSESRVLPLHQSPPMRAL